MATKTHQSLMTNRQREVYDAIAECIARDGISPTFDELATAFEMRKASMAELIGLLKAKGFVDYQSRKRRSLTIVCPPDADPRPQVKVPVLGVVVAGYPVDVTENVIGHVNVEASLVKKDRCFALRVDGESMIRANIDDGDIVVVRQQRVADSGDIVVAGIDGKATVKRFHHRDGSVELRPANGRFATIKVTDDMEFTIMGKVIDIIKK